MFAKVIEEKFYYGTDDAAVQAQARTLMGLLTASGHQKQVISDILQLSMTEEKAAPERIAWIGFLMGVQYGFELAQTYPALPRP
jgi:hypothetical protein